MVVLGNVITPQGLEPLQFPTKFRSPSLTPSQRICYLASMYHWTIGLPKLIFYLAPGWILFSGTFPIANFGTTFLIIYGSFLATLILTYQVLSRGSGRLLMDEFFNMAMCFSLLQALKRFAVAPHSPGKFVVTDKRGTGRRSVKEILPHLTLLAFTTLALGWGLNSLAFGVSDDRFGVALCAFWATYNIILMGGVVALSLRPPQKRQRCRFVAAFPVELSHGAGARDLGARIGMTADLSDSGCTLLWPSTLPQGTRWPLIIHLGPTQMRCGPDPIRWTV